MLLRPVYCNFKFFKKDDNFIKGDSPNGSNTTTALEKNKIDDIHVADNISDGFNEIPMKFPPLTPEKKALCREVKQIKFTFT